jgi:hypothetical protein
MAGNPDGILRLFIEGCIEGYHWSAGFEAEMRAPPFTLVGPHKSKVFQIQTLLPGLQKTLRGY